MDFLRLLEGIRTPAGEQVFGVITQFGGAVLVVLVICALYWCYDKRFAYKIGFGFFLSGLVVQGLKLLCRIERPWVKDPNFVHSEIGFSDAGGYSFPSGHSQNAANFFGMLIMRLKRWYVRVFMGLMIALVMFSRMYLGFHTPLDVCVGFVIGIVVSVLVYYVSDRIKMTDRNRLIITCAVILFSVGLVIYDAILYKEGIIEYVNAADCFKLGGAGIALAICWYVEGRYVNFETGGVPFWKQVLKLVLGVAGLLVFEQGPKLLLGVSPVVDMSRYFLAIVWGMGIYPVIIKKCFCSK